MTTRSKEFYTAIEATRIHTASYATRTDFRNYWLGFTQESRDYLAQQVRVFGELLAPVAENLAGWRILDVGCGDGQWLRRMVEYDAKPEDVLGVDVSDARFAVGQAKNPLVQLIKTDGVSLPFEDQHFDLITQFVCFSNIPTSDLRRRVSGEMSRVLRKGGYIFWWDLSQATAPSDRGARIEPSDYFDWPICRRNVAQRPRPSECLRSSRVARLTGRLLDMFSYPPTHIAALIGPKP